MCPNKVQRCSQRPGDDVPEPYINPPHQAQFRYFLPVIDSTRWVVSVLSLSTSLIMFYFSLLLVSFQSSKKSQERPHESLTAGAHESYRCFSQSAWTEASCSGLMFYLPFGSQIGFFACLPMRVYIYDGVSASLQRTVTLY